MKNSFIVRYFNDVTYGVGGERFSTIMRYFIPEFITNFLLYAMPFWLDAAFIASLSSTPTYAALGITNNFLHLIIKVAEAVSVGTIVLSGRFNGQNSYEDAGRTLRDSFWITTILGLCFSTMLFFGAHAIYSWYGVGEDVIELGVPFLRLRAIGVLFMFIYLAFVGFLRGIKNARAPMKIFIVGSILFVLFDYMMIFGACGFPAMGLRGSAWATIIQYGFMMLVASWYVLFNKKNRKYGIDLFSAMTDISYVKHLLILSWPVVLDKSMMAWAYIWLNKMIATMGTHGAAAFYVVKDMERMGFLPALACAQVITFLVSNDCGSQNWNGIKNNIKKTILIAFVMIAIILLFFMYFRAPIITFFDRKGEFTELAYHAFPILSIFVFFDMVQLILSGALRGSGNVHTVMIMRFVTCFLFFVPFSYFLSLCHFKNDIMKFVLMYGSFYFSNALTCFWYIKKFRGDEWKITAIRKH